MPAATPSAGAGVPSPPEQPVLPALTHRRVRSTQEDYRPASAVGVNFTWEFDGTGTIHARHIVTDHGWKISLDRGLDIFQHYEMNDAFTFANRLQQYRPCKAFEVTYIKNTDRS